MGKYIERKDELNQKVNSIDFDTHTVRTYTGDEFQADFLVSTIPWKEYKEVKGMPLQLQESVRNLQHTAIRIDYFDRNLDPDAHWIYNPNPEGCYHRILAGIISASAAKSTGLKQTVKELATAEMLNEK